jgi:hypothetical protein
MKTPHLLLAAPNAYDLRDNLVHLLPAPAIAAINSDIAANVVALFRMGEEYFRFAKALPVAEWRHKISRLYYSAYAISRAVRFQLDGAWSKSPGEHKKVGALPRGFPNQSTYANRLTVLREDRNLADYDHACSDAELVISVPDAEALVEQFARDARTFLAYKGITV